MRGIFVILILACLCGCDNKKDLTKLKYKPTKSGTAYIAITDSGFVINFVGDDIYHEYVFKEDKIIMYSDSLYEYNCNVKIRYSDNFYINHLNALRNTATCGLKPSMIDKDCYVYTCEYKRFNHPSFFMPIRGFTLTVNGINNKAEVDLEEIGNIANVFEANFYECTGVHI